MSLRAVIEDGCEYGYNLGDLTVLAVKNDPFRVDTPAGHRDGGWLAEQMERLGLGDAVTHLRGLHYAIFSAVTTKPNGLPYENREDDWVWLSETAAKAARWLGLVDFEQIRDARSSPPVIRPFVRPLPEAWISVGVHVEIPAPEDLVPTAYALGFSGVQPYKLVLFGEKTSLEDVLAPIAENHEADLFLPSGEMSDSHLHAMANAGADDGRPMVVLVVADCDPAGWQMAISIGRKLQALRELQFPELEFQVHRVALLPEHVRAYGLPSTPLKATEQRADKWLAATGVEQTEVDALAALQPQLLERLVLEAIDPFYDRTLARRVMQARDEWRQRAQAALEEQMDKEELERIRAEAAEKLAELEKEIATFNEQMRVGVGAIELPEIVVPEAEQNGHLADEPLIDSEWDWVEQTLSLKRSKDYG